MNLIAMIDFPDGTVRHVFETPDRRQYVLDENGHRVFGVWHVSRKKSDTPVIIEAAKGEFGKSECSSTSG